MVKDILIRTFGAPRRDSRTQFTFNCPRCAELYNNFKLDNKYNLEVNLNNQDKRFKIKKIFHCWKCDYSGGLHKLIRQYSSDIDYSLFCDLDDELTMSFSVDNVKVEPIKLPKEFIAFDSDKYDEHDISHLEMFNYLERRNIGWEIIKKNNIGFALSGKYYRRIIIPSYDKLNKLNYYVTRAVFKTKFKYMNPRVPKTEFIFNESNINWNSTVFLVEGVFDMFTLPPNTIPLLGKTLYENLLEKLVKYKPNVLICLDQDAFKMIGVHNPMRPKSSAGIYKTLKSYGLENVKVLDISKEDLGYYFEKGGKKAIFELLNNNIRELDIFDE